jgi:hypothetical protein
LRDGAVQQVWWAEPTLQLLEVFMAGEVVPQNKEPLREWYARLRLENGIGESPPLPEHIVRKNFDDFYAADWFGALSREQAWEQYTANDNHSP